MTTGEAKIIEKIEGLRAQMDRLERELREQRLSRIEQQPPKRRMSGNRRERAKAALLEVLRDTGGLSHTEALSRVIQVTNTSKSTVYRALNGLEGFVQSDNGWWSLAQ